jgi:hypothetical protein
LGVAAATLAAPMVGASTRQARARANVDGAERFVPGGFGGLESARYTYTPTSRDETYGTIPLPRTPPIGSYMVPLTVKSYDESSGTRYQLLGDGLVTIMKDGLYILTANFDWPAMAHTSGQDGYDIDLRSAMIKRVRVGVTPPIYTPGKVTFLPENGSAYDAMGTHNTPGSSCPHAVRAVAEWAPGYIPAGGMAYIDVLMPVGCFAPVPGDLARASHPSLTDAMLGGLNAGLLISARIVAPQLVRVMIENRYNPGPVNIPSGLMNVMAESAVSSAGNSTDAMSFVGSGPVELFAGEKIMTAVRSHTNGDYLQISQLAFLRITNLVP